MSIRRDARLTLEQSKKITKARTLGFGTALPIYLEDIELAKLIAVILADLGGAEVITPVPSLPDGPFQDYYQIPLSWFTSNNKIQDFIALLAN